MKYRSWWDNERRKKGIMSKPLIIAVDMDGCICKQVCWTRADCVGATPNWEIIKIVNELSETKHIVIYTARKDRLIPATLEWLRRHEVKFDAISNNKMPADAYIDDKAINVDDADSLKLLLKA